MAQHKTRPQRNAIRSFIIENVTDHPRDITSITAKKFGISRQAAHRHIQQLAHENVIRITGRTRAREYALKPIASHTVSLDLSPSLKEDQVWREHVLPRLEGVKPNVLALCEYGCTEMVSNAIDHSEGTKVSIQLVYTPARIRLVVKDDGVGIFHKVQTKLGLEDEHHAILELAKGKLTTDPQRHTGEGVFFTSRVFDTFTILSGNLRFITLSGGSDWLLEDQRPILGTTFIMDISTQSKRRTQEIFDKYASQDDDYGFTKTHVPVTLAKYGPENLVSRSQAKRLLARFDRFREVVLDFKNVETIGQAFADEIFRVYVSAHPNVHITPINATGQIRAMIHRAESQPTPSLLEAPISTNSTP
jgi:anti-sigma regulatory factor (Ser/Thr protein kinase)/uncharacterized protein (DUF1330 family)